MRILSVSPDADALLTSHLQHIRLLACVVAKNAVGSSWRKTLGTREWSRVPEAEKEAVRQAAAMQLLLGAPQHCFMGGWVVTVSARAPWFRRAYWHS
jgi:hypothetical protein